MVNWEDTDVLEAKIAPLEEWAGNNADDDDCLDSIEMIGLMTRRMRRNPAKAATAWKQLLAEGAYHDDWPIGGQGNASNLHPVIRAIARDAKESVTQDATTFFNDNAFVQFIALKRPRGTDPLFHTAETYGKAKGQAAYNAIVNLHKDGYLTVEDGLDGVSFDTYNTSDDGDDSE